MVLVQRVPFLLHEPVELGRHPDGLVFVGGLDVLLHEDPHVLTKSGQPNHPSISPPVRCASWNFMLKHSLDSSQKKTLMTRLWPPFGTKPKWSTNSEKMSPIYPSISSYDQRNCNVWRSIQKQSELMLNIYEPSCVALLPLNKWKWHRIFTPHRVNSPHFAISVVDWTILIFTILFNIFNHTIFIELHLIFTIEIDHLFTTLNH